MNYQVKVAPDHWLLALYVYQTLQKELTHVTLEDCKELVEKLTPLASWIETRVGKFNGDHISEAIVKGGI